MSLNSDALRLFLAVVDAGTMSAGRRDAGPDRFRRQPRPVAAGGRPGRDPADPHHAAHGTDRGRRAVPAEGARHRRVAGRGRGMHAHGAPAARRPAARRRLGAGHAALRGAACGRVPPRLSRDHAGADQQRPHRRPDGTPQRRGAARRPADRLHTARPPAAPRAALAAGQPRLHRAPGRAEGRGRTAATRAAGLHAAGKPERLAAAPRGRLQLRHHAHAGHLQRRDPVPAAARRGHRLPVRLHGARRAGRRPAGEGDGTRVHRLPAAAECRLLPQHAAVAAHRLLPGFHRGADGRGAGHERRRGSRRGWRGAQYFRPVSHNTVATTASARSRPDCSSFTAAHTLAAAE